MRFNDFTKFELKLLQRLLRESSKARETTPGELTDAMRMLSEIRVAATNMGVREG